LSFNEIVNSKQNTLYYHDNVIRPIGQNTTEETIFRQKVSRVGLHSLRKNANYHSDICTANRASRSHFWHTHGTPFTKARMRSQHVAPRGTLRSSRQRLMQLTISTPSTDSFLISTQQ